MNATNRDPPYPAILRTITEVNTQEIPITLNW
jgi:hypothetical protein